MEHNKSNESQEFPQLDALRGNGDGFRMPDGYLNSLTDAVLEKAKRPARRRSLRVWYVAASAAAVLLLLIGFWRAENALEGDRMVISAEAFVAELSEEEVLAYVDANIETFELELLLEAGEADNSLPVDSIPGAEILDELLDDFTLEELEEIL